MKHIYKYFSRQLNAWYRRESRTLPWRETRDPYKIWISEIMLQQTTVNAAIPYYQRWIQAFPRIEDVSKSPLQKILKLWQGLGYYQRARNLHKAAKILVKEYDGNIPQNPSELKKLPGFGSYTVGAVLSIAFDIRYPIIDANVRRVVMRILAIEGLANPKIDERILLFLEAVLPQKNVNIFNQALMELGALICRTRSPLCLNCPVKSFCKAYAKGIQEIIPTPKKQNYKDLKVVIGIIKKRNKYFIQKRNSKGLLADLWEFPGGKVEKGENFHQALNREMMEECASHIVSSQFFMKTKHFYTHHRVDLHVYLCDVDKYPKTDNDHKWASLKELNRYPVPSGTARIIEHLKK